MRKNLIICCLIIIIVFGLNSCFLSKNTDYSFVIAGHTYGKPYVNNIGFHPPYKTKLQEYMLTSKVDFGFLLGDIVWLPTDKDWDEIDKDIDSIGIPFYLVCGNHEMKDSVMFVNRYGPTYYHFTKNHDLFIVLNPNISSWNIDGRQLQELKQILSKYSKKTDNIFVFTHQLLWWDYDNKYSDITLNSLEDRDENLNFWSEIEPLFHELDNNVVFCAGDIGATEKASDYMFDQYDNITFIASGMGEGNGDNFVVIKVDSDKKISFELVFLNSDKTLVLDSIQYLGL